MTGHLVARTMWVQVDVSIGKLSSPNLVDDHLLELHRVGGGTGWHRVLSTLANVDQ